MLYRKWIIPGKTLLLKRFGQHLRVFRKQKMLSREELACRVRFTEKDIEELDNGKGDPKLSTLLLLADALNISPQELLIQPGRYDSQYHAYRFYLLQLINKMSKKELKEAIEILRSLLLHP